MPKVAPLFLALLLPLAARAQAPVPVGAVQASYDEPFTGVSAVRELPGGKVLVVDLRDKLVEVVDLATGTATKVGREGSGPGEYQFPRTLLAMPNNETFLADPMQNRFLRIGPDGKVLETVSWPEGTGPGMQVVGADAEGRIYWEGSAFGRSGGQITVGGDGGLETRDSVPVLRWDRRTGKMDTLALVRGPQLKANISGGPNSRSVMIRQQPFSARDAWGVAPDGRVAIARSGDYRVDNILATGRRLPGAAVGVPPLPVTDRDKQDFLRQQRSAPRMVRTVGGNGAAPPAPPEPSADEYQWPAAKPFFESTGVLMSPTGELWVLRSRAAGDETRVYDVFDARGRLARRVSFPVRTWLVGFGQGALYTVHTDDDDLQYLERRGY